MHILYLHQYFCPPGGSGNNRSYELARNWIKAGHKVTMITTPAYLPSTFKYNVGGMTEVDGIELWVANVPYSHFMSFRERVKAFLKFYRKGKAICNKLNGDVDLIYASSTPPSVGELGRKIARRRGIPYIFETVDVWPDVPAGMGLLKSRFILNHINKRVNRIYRESSFIVALSDGMKEQVVSHGVNPAKVLVGYNGTNPEVFRFHERVQKEVTTVVYTGTIGKANGVGAIVKVAKKLESDQRIRFRILGNGNDLEQVKKLADELEPKNLEFIETLPKEAVDGFLSEADIGLVTFAPYKVLEANSANKFYDYLASGLPVVLNYEGWQARYLDEFECGLHSPQGDEDAFAANIAALAGDPERRLAMGKRGRALAAESFDRQKIAAMILEKMEKLVRK